MNTFIIQSEILGVQNLFSVFLGNNVRFILSPLVDQIYHLASPASPPNYMYNPIKTLKTNTIGTLNMLGKLLFPDFAAVVGNTVDSSSTGNCLCYESSILVLAPLSHSARAISFQCDFAIRIGHGGDIHNHSVLPQFSPQDDPLCFRVMAQPSSTSHLTHDMPASLQEACWCLCSEIGLEWTAHLCTHTRVSGALLEGVR